MFLCYVPLSLPLPYITITSPTPILARIQQTFCGDQHKSKKYFLLSTRAKQVSNFLVTESIYETSSCWEDQLWFVSPMINPGGLNATQALDNKKKNS